MCGIAGFCASDRFVDKYLSAEKQNKILVEAWLHNQHRGYEAAGFMGFTRANKLVSWKRKGSASNLLIDKSKKNRVPNLEAMGVFGAHTRQSTIGDPKLNMNNHPVRVGKVLVNHNGSVDNHEKLKDTLGFSYEPEVDSALIAAVLDGVDFRDIEAVAVALKPLTGNIAFHAISQDYPGVSVLCRGTGSPLLLAYHKAGILVYGSTADSIYGMILAMGLQPDDEKWVWRSLDTNKIIIVENGIPIAYGSKPVRYYAHSGVGAYQSKADYFVKRILPPLKGSFNETEPFEVYSTDLTIDWPVKAGELGRNLDAMPESQQLETVYTRKEGVLKKGQQWNIGSMLGVFSEADLIIYDKINYTYHAYFGDVEIMVGADRKMLDVYDHSKFSTSERWITVEKEDVKAVLAIEPIYQSPLPWDDFYKACTTHLTAPSEEREYVYLTNLKDLRAKQQQEKESKQRTKQKSLPMTSSNGEIISDNNDFEEKIRSLFVVDWDSFGELIWNKSMGWAFVSDGVCPAHNVHYSEHHKANICRTTTFAMLYGLSCAVDLHIAKNMCDGLELEEDLTLASCEARQHYWVPNSCRMVTLGNMTFDLVVAEDCTECGSYRRLINFPGIADTLFGPVKDVLNVGK